MRHALLLVLLAMLNIPTLAPAHSQSSASEAPFLYYYSQAESAFIIERADGADRRVLADYEISGTMVGDVRSRMAGPGWSPSGKWFIFGEANSVNRYTQHLTLVSRDGQINLDLSDVLADYFSYRWSPTADILYVANFTETALLVFQDDAYTVKQLPSAKQPYSKSGWLPNGQLLVMSVEDNSNTVFYGEIIDPAQTTKSQSVGQFVASDLWLRAAPDGSFLFFDENRQLTFFDSETGQQHRIESAEQDLPPIPDALWTAYWSLDSQTALINVDNTSYILNRAALNLAYLAEDLYFTDTRLYRHIDYPDRVERSLWSPDGRFFVATDASQNMVVYAIENEGVNLLSTFETAIKPFWTSSNQLLFVQQTATDYGLVQFDPETNTSQAVAAIVNQNDVGYVDFTPDDGRLIYTERGHLYLIDRHNEQKTEVNPFADGPEFDISTRGIYSFKGDPTSQWLLTWGSDDLGNIRVVDVANGTLRDLTFCNMEPACFGWLPDLTD